MRHANSQSGNILFIILIAVALLSALAFAVTQGIQNSGKGLSEDRRALAATEILEYASAMTKTVSMLKLRGCKEDEINFANNTTAAYNNGGAPSGNICDIYNRAGGAMTWAVPPNGSVNTNPSPTDAWAIYGTNEIQGIGSTGADDDNADLVLFLNDVTLTMCQTLNERLGVMAAGAAPPTDADTDTTAYTGTFTYTETIGDTDTDLARKSAACYQDTTAGIYRFYKVLRAR